MRRSPAVICTGTGAMTIMYMYAMHAVPVVGVS